MKIEIIDSKKFCIKGLHTTFFSLYTYKPSQELYLIIAVTKLFTSTQDFVIWKLIYLLCIIILPHYEN